MIKQRKIELLAPAKNLECGIEAVNHGADAVYIGAPKFGARAAAVNSLEDIAALTAYAHLYNVRIYVTVNTILKEEELAETEKMIWELYRIGADALIVQDMGITRLNLPPIPLHGSTQMDNRTPEKVRTVLRQSGMLWQKRQPGRVRPVLPPAVQSGGCGRKNHRPRQAPALFERLEPK